MEGTLYHRFRNYPHSINKKSEVQRDPLKNCQSFREALCSGGKFKLTPTWQQKLCSESLWYSAFHDSQPIKCFFSGPLFKGFSLIKKIYTKKKKKKVYTTLPSESQNLDIREPIVFYCFSGNNAILQIIRTLC